MATLGDSSSGLWSLFGQASNVAQLVGVDALGLVSMVVQAALAARRHRDACRRLAQHVEIVGGLLQELELADLMRREATRRPLEQIRGALRRCYALVRACQDCGYLRSLLVGARMADELRSAEQEIDMFIRLIPLIALVDTTHSNRFTQTLSGVPGENVITNTSIHHVRFPSSVLEFTKIHVQGADELCNVVKEPLSGMMNLQEQKILDIEELLELCSRTEENCPGFKKFEFNQIVHATDNFSQKRNAGCGGFATVYKGLLSDGRMIAVKRLDEHATLFDFRNEFLVARLQHANLVKLLGWCIHGKERILVYEFMVNGSLHQFIFARTLSSDVAEERSSKVVGTSGYKAPEYASRGIYSVKTDVFSFGVLSLVIISGRKNFILEQKGDTVGNLVRDAWHLWKDGRLHELVDPVLGDGYELAEIVQCAQVALLCAQEDPTDRPTMSDVVALLNFESVSLLPDPKEPSELIKGGPGDKLSKFISQSSRTIDITITSSAPVSTRVRIILDAET
ncbi:hypothetical protein PR202_ga14541 [Eleusine coracana subsp. coracana]|uniref:Protein kinase domain-containing protein n=1 Tax=Eleusine coracana subsp. coracana TaxID=191504 RepID=A0AAV5CHI7_ELECO|nr:hypothetical protein PR202_ga14541 [Eleusine coracana subsp. coracana]